MEIEQVSNGYIVTNDLDTKEICATLDEVFSSLLLHFEGRSLNFSGDSFGKVVVKRTQANTKKDAL